MGFYLTRTSNARPIPHEVVLAFIMERQHVSFAELQAFLEKRGYPARGEWQISLGVRDHLVLWRGLSEALFRSLQELIAGRKVFLHPASLMTYVVDGVALPLPLAQTLEVNSDHWLPATLCSFPCPKGTA